MTDSAVDLITPVPFDATQPLPAGVTVLEASAGTGKTHTVASIVVREVAEGRPLEEILVVTFTRKATGTLRERVWHRLAAAARALDASEPEPVDPLLVHLRRGSAADVAERKHRLEQAVSGFDAATVATTHGFCQQVLASLGVAGDAERELEVVETVHDLVEDAVDDMFVRRFHAGDREILFSRKDALRIADAVVNNPDALIAEVDERKGAELRRKFAMGLRDRVADQKRRGRLVTYDDLLTRLDDTIRNEVRGPVAVDRLRHRFSMAIVDEFQDTDAVQWRILRAAFGSGQCRLVVVGDPKQAVYAFRGGDIYAYLQATESASSRLSLDVSWRADQSLLDGLDAFFDGAQLGASSIRHRPLEARPGAESARLLGSAAGSPFTIRVVDRSMIPGPGRHAAKDDIRAVIFADMATEAVRLLSSDLEIIERDAQGLELPGRHAR